jgi:hypothetical protein
MRAREKLVAFVLIVGAYLLAAAIRIELAMMEPEASYTYTTFSQGEWLRNQLLKWGTIIFVIGCFLLLVTYLTRRWGFERTYSQTLIIALFCTNQQGEMVIYPEGYAPHSLRYHVRLTLPNGESDEFECSLALFQQLREGMRGCAVCKGNQLLAFYPDADRMSG